MKHSKKLKAMYSRIMDENAALIYEVAGTIFALKLCKSFGIPVGGFWNFFGIGGGINETKNIGNVILSIGSPATATQTAIYACYKNASGLDDNYYKKGEGERIYDILRRLDKDSIDDATKMYAIEALTGIQEMIDDGYYKRRVGDIIQKVLAI